MIAREGLSIGTELFTSTVNSNHVYLLDYQDNRQFIISTKYHLNLSSVKLFTGSIADYLPSELYEKYPMVTDWMIVPVPLYWRSRLKRRFSLNHIIAKQLANRLGYQYLNCLSNRSAKTQGQAGSKTQRLKNAAHKFKLKKLAHKKIINKNIILLDDVVATGATMKTCEQILKNAGARQVVWLSLGH